jgi:hypothetical protein
MKRKTNLRAFPCHGTSTLGYLIAPWPWANPDKPHPKKPRGKSGCHSSLRRSPTASLPLSHRPHVEIGTGWRITESIFGDYSYTDRYADVSYSTLGKFANIAASCASIRVSIPISAPRCIISAPAGAGLVGLGP